MIQLLGKVFSVLKAFDSAGDILQAPCILFGATIKTKRTYQVDKYA
jgi:hypothetical protein